MSFEEQVCLYCESKDVFKIPSLPETVLKPSTNQRIGKVVDDIHKEQVAVEDNNRLLEVIKTASMDINQVSASVSKNTDMKTAIDLFEASTKADKYASLTANDRPRVKKQFNEWLNKTKISEYSSIAKQVTKNHIDKTKTTHNEYLDGLTLMMASSDITKASNARTDFESFFTKAVNGSVYSSSEFAKVHEAVWTKRLGKDVVEKAGRSPALSNVPLLPLPLLSATSPELATSSFNLHQPCKLSLER